MDVQRNLVYLRGCVPGPQGGIVRVTDSRKASTCAQMESMYDLPVPTWLPVTRRRPTPSCRLACHAAPATTVIHTLAAQTLLVQLYRTGTSSVQYSTVTRSPILGIQWLH